MVRMKSTAIKLRGWSCESTMYLEATGSLQKQIDRLHTIKPKLPAPSLDAAHLATPCQFHSVIQGGVKRIILCA